MVAFWRVNLASTQKWWWLSKMHHRTSTQNLTFDTTEILQGSYKSTILACKRLIESCSPDLPALVILSITLSQLQYIANCAICLDTIPSNGRGDVATNGEFLCGGCSGAAVLAYYVPGLRSMIVVSWGRMRMKQLGRSQLTGLENFRGPRWVCYWHTRQTDQASGAFCKWAISIRGIREDACKYLIV